VAECWSTPELAFFRDERFGAATPSLERQVVPSRLSTISRPM
jgi:hypothetical protein